MADAEAYSRFMVKDALDIFGCLTAREGRNTTTLLQELNGTQPATFKFDIFPDVAWNDNPHPWKDRPSDAEAEERTIEAIIAVYAQSFFKRIRGGDMAVSGARHYWRDVRRVFLYVQGRGSTSEAIQDHVCTVEAIQEALQPADPADLLAAVSARRAALCSGSARVPRTPERRP